MKSFLNSKLISANSFTLLMIQVIYQNQYIICNYLSKCGYVSEWII